MNNEEIKADKPNTNTEAKKAEETKTESNNVTVNVNEGSSWIKPTLWCVGGILCGALGAIGVSWFLNRDSNVTTDTTADA